MANFSQALTQRTVSNFGALWTVTAVSNLADGVFKLALPIYATHLTSSPGLVAGVVFAVRLPWLIFALHAGAIVDRLDRRQVLMGANMVRVLILSAVTLSVALGIASLPLLYAVALILGVAETLADTAAAALVPAVVEKSNLESANAKLVGTITLTNEFLGPPLGGFLVAISIVLALGTSAGFYLVGVLALMLMTGIYRPTQPHTAPRLRDDVIVGLRFVWRNQVLRTLALIVGVMNMGWSAWLSVMVLYMVAPGPGGLSEVGYGLMLTSIGIGGIMGTVLAVPLTQRFGRRTVIGADILGTFLFLAIPALTANVWLVGWAAVMAGIGGSLWSVVVTSIRQAIVPDAMLGRVGGAFRLFGYGALPLGSALAGLLAELVGLQVVFAGGAILTLMLFIPFFRYLHEENLG